MKRKKRPVDLAKRPLRIGIMNVADGKCEWNVGTDGTRFALKETCLIKGFHGADIHDWHGVWKHEV
jgi:hypothetical protein